jgi:hypothetical protein
MPRGVQIDLPCYLYEFPAYDSTMDGVFVRMDALPMQTVSFPHGSYGKCLAIHLVAFAYACRTLFVDELDMFSYEFCFLYHGSTISISSLSVPSQKSI